MLLSYCFNFLGNMDGGGCQDGVCSVVLRVGVGREGGLSSSLGLGQTSWGACSTVIVSFQTSALHHQGACTIHAMRVP